MPGKVNLADRTEHVNFFRRGGSALTLRAFRVVRL